MRHNAFLAQCLSLTHPKSVLFVRDDHSQLFVMNLFLDQCMCSDDNIRFLIFNPFISQPLLLGSHGAGQELRTVRKVHPLHQRKDRFIMLSCQNLRRNHDRSLTAVFCSQKKSQLCQDRFSGAHVSLDQPGRDVL